MGRASSGRAIRQFIKLSNSAETIYPTNIAAPYTVISGSGAGVAGDYVTIFTAGQLSYNYKIIFVNSLGLSATSAFRIRFYLGDTPIFVGACSFVRTSNFERGGATPIQTGNSGLLLNKSQILRANAIASVASPITMTFSVSIILEN